MKFIPHSRCAFDILLVAMATSSITANFTISDPKAARAFARALCAERSWAIPAVKVDYRHVTDPHEIDSFFRNSPYAKRRARKVSAR